MHPPKWNIHLLNNYANMALKKKMQYFLAVILFCFSHCWVGIINISGDSMSPTLKNGEFYFVQKKGYDVTNGDIVLVSDDCFTEKYVVKRVIAVEGQTVSLIYDENKVLIDGKVVNEPYINYTEDDELKPYNGRNYETYTVPVNCVFLMGDNRNHSVDSRKNTIGCISISSIIGILHVH